MHSHLALCMEGGGAEIDQLDFAVLLLVSEQEIVQLQVAVDDSHAVAMSHDAEDLADHVSRSLLCVLAAIGNPACISIVVVLVNNC